MESTGKTYFKVLLNLLTAVVVVLLIVFLLPKVVVYFLPFVIGWIISLIAAPFVSFFEDKFKIKRKAGSALVIVLVLAVVIAIVYALGYFLVIQAMEFIKEFPAYWESMVNELEKVGNSLTGVYNKLPVQAQNVLFSISGNADKFFGSLSFGVKEPGDPSKIGSVVSSIPDVILGIVMALLSSYFFVAEKDYIGKAMEKYLPKSVAVSLDIVKRSIKNAFGGYIKAQLKIEIWVYFSTAIGLLIVKADYVFLIALLVSFLDFIPVFGAGAIMIPWAVFRLFEQDYKMAIGLLITWGIGQFVRDMIRPKIVGDSVGISPIPTLFLLFIGYQVMGFAGMILAIPVGIIIKNLHSEGAFDTTYESISILVAGFNRFRKLQKQDKEIIVAYEQDLEKEYRNRFKEELDETDSDNPSDSEADKEDSREGK